MRARRLFVDRDLSYVAKEADISPQQLSRYELGLGNPPIGTLCRIASCLGVDASDLLSEAKNTEMQEMYETLKIIYADPFIGAVIRYMQDMSVDDRRRVRTKAAEIGRNPTPQTVKVMK